MDNDPTAIFNLIGQMAATPAGEGDFDENDARMVRGFLGLPVDLPDTDEKES